MSGPIGFQVTFDAADPHAQARFWAAALGYEVELHDDFIRATLASGVPAELVVEIDGHLFWRTAAAIRPPGATDEDARRGRRLLFQAVPEAKPAKNRVHLDLNVGEARVEEEVQRLLGLGASLLYRHEDIDGRWVTLADPEGNEFCVQ
jgi:hypothetical protein